MRVKASIVLASTALFSLLAYSQPAAVRIESIQVADHIYMLTGQGGNIGLAVDDDYTLLIDDQFGELSDAIKAEITTITDKPIAYLLNTHFHYDHTSGNPAFSGSVGVIVAQENVRTRLRDGSAIRAFGKVTEPLAEKDLPALTFSDRLAIHQMGEEIHLIHFAHAHTDGDTVVYFKDSNVIHAGDIYFSGNYPFIDTSNGGDVHGYIKAMERLLALADDETKIIPGHGVLSTRADLQRDLTMLREVVAVVESELEAGHSLEAILVHPLIQRYDGSHGHGALSTRQFVEILMDALKWAHSG